jgi:hypothetical protein
MANFCTNCGRALDGTGAFCKYCGAPLSAPAQPQWQPPQQETQQPQWQQPTQPAQQWQQPQQPYQQPVQPYQQPTTTQQWSQSAPAQPATAAQWTPPRTAQRTQQAAAATGWTAPRTTVGSPAAQINQAFEDFADRRLDERNRAAGTGQYAPAGVGARMGIPAPGWSDRVNDPELLAALQKQKKAGKRLSAFIVPLPLIGFLIYGAVSDNMEIGKALLYGAIVSVIFLIFALIGGKKSSGNAPYEAVVVDKRTQQRRRSNGSDDSGRREYSYYTELITIVQTTAGERKKIVESDQGRNQAWDYLQIGERFRYHPEFNFPYELYDKSHAACLYCPVCEKKNPVTEDRCRKCGAPLLK